MHKSQPWQTKFKEMRGDAQIRASTDFQIMKSAHQKANLHYKFRLDM